MEPKSKHHVPLFHAQLIQIGWKYVEVCVPCARSRRRCEHMCAEASSKCVSKGRWYRECQSKVFRYCLLSSFEARPAELVWYWPGRLGDRPVSHPQNCLQACTSTPHLHVIVSVVYCDHTMRPGVKPSTWSLWEPQSFGFYSISNFGEIKLSLLK